MSLYVNINENVAQTRRSYEQIYTQYAENNKMNEVIQANLDKFIAHLKGQRVLDVGCAQGRESLYLREKGLEVSGCDLTPEFIELAKKNCPKGEFRVADMRDLPYDPNQFDGVWASASYLHVPKSDGLRTLQGFNTVLGSQGLLYLSVMEGEHDALRENKQMNWPARHFADYKLDELTNLLNRSGFRVIENNSVQTSWGPTFLHMFARKE